jgi:hypothetical protein
MTYKVDFFAKRIHFLEHMLPIWKQLGERQGEFYVSEELYRDCAGREFGADIVDIPRTANEIYDFPGNGNPIVTAAYGDLTDVLTAERTLKQPRRIKMFMEHGAGFTFRNGHPSYSGGNGERKHVDLFLNPNEYVSGANIRAYPDIPNVVIGCPKLDKRHQLVKEWQCPENPVIAVSFHWDCRVALETRSAFPWFQSALPILAKKYKVIGHGHPRNIAEMRPIFKRMGIEMVDDFEQVMDQADVYVNDASSTLYEFASLGKPVVVLNAPIYRRSVRFGLRFWEHADVGVNCDDAAHLVQAVDKALQNTPDQQQKRIMAVEAAYPVRGNAAQTAVNAIDSFLSAKPLPKLSDYARSGEPFTHINGKSIGIIYMAFGEKAALGVEASVRTLRRLGFQIPVTVVGSSKVRNADFIEWNGQSPFDADQKKNFQFRAGRVKPFLYDYSPYDYSLYIDADTEFMRDITPGFLMLDQHDIAIAEEMNPISKLYNKPLAGWEVNIEERDYTLQAIGHDEKFLNSGVLFFRKSAAAEEVFKRWQAEWPRFSQWDEQLALTRAIYQVPELQVKRLAIDWNHPHRNKSRTVVIFHNYGRGDVRSNVA